MFSPALSSRLSFTFPNFMILGGCALLAWGAAINSSAGAADSETRRAGQPAAASDDGALPGAARRLAIASFEQQNPASGLHRDESRITRIYGQAFGHGDGPEQSAEQFRAQHAAMFGVPVADLRPGFILDEQRHTQQMMFDRQTGEYKFTLVYYSQYVNGIPVFRADLRLLVRNESDYPLVLASANLRAVGEFAPNANAVDLTDTSSWEDAATDLVPGLQNFTQPELVVWAGVDDMIVEPVLAVTFVGDNGWVPNGDEPEMPERWLFVVDATTGKILYQENQIFETDVAGNVRGMATQGSGADFCEAEALEEMSYARVNIGGTTVYADEFGDFLIPNGGDSEVTVQSPVRGQYFHVFNAAAVDTVLSTDVVPPGPADFVHNAFNSSEFMRAEVNAYVQANVIRDIILEANPTYPTISTQTELETNVNLSGGLCPGNAWYSPGAQSINFCRTGSGYPNTAWSAIVHHEYGHHLVAMGGSGQGAYGEGMGDVMSVVALDDHRLGLGFLGNCNSWLRDANNNCQYQTIGCSSCGSEGHVCGQLLSGCVWSTRNELIVTEPFSYLDVLRDLSVNSVLLHSGSGIAPDITIDWLTLDDDDDNIGNGTPHYDEIAAGFGAHNMPAPELQAIEFTYPEGRPDLLSPNTSTVIAVNVESIVGTPVPGTGTLSYRIGGSGFFTTISMTEGTPNEYEATLPAADCLQTVQYYFTADSEEVSGLTDPLDAPATTFEAVVATGQLTSFEDDFETNQGWSVTNAAGDGPWNRGIPVGCNRGDPPSDSDGSGQCYLTDNSSANGCNSDVDDGSTTLTSPVMDASAAGSTISYDRWYSNTEGAGPMQDVFVVQVSDDGGSSWVNLETVGPAGAEVGGGWFHKEFFLAGVAGLELTDQFRIRFIASDTDPQSVVEAAVDRVRLFAFECEDLCSADFDGDGSVNAADLAALLGAWGPGPSDPADLDGDDDVDAADLAILLGNWGACP